MGPRATSRPAAVEDAAERLYGAPLSQFTAERKSIASALRAAGDRTAATAVGALPRPSLAAWAVNRLQREAGDDLEALFAAAQEMRRGQQDAGGTHRELLGKLRARAAAVLVADGHAASETTLRRVASTLLALSARGSFEPDPPGQLVSDLDPPGFEVMAGLAASLPSASAAPPARTRRSDAASSDRDEDYDDSARDDDDALAAEDARLREAQARARALAVERASAELARIERTLAEARRYFDARQHDVEGIQERLQFAETARDQAARRVAELDDERARAATNLAELTEDQEPSR